MHSKSLFTLALVALLLHVAALRALAQVTVVEGEDGKPTVYKMTVSPAAEARPPLKYHFLVPPVDKTPGNAALFYYKAMDIEGQDWIMQVGNDDKLDEWLATPLDQMSKLPDTTRQFDRDTLESLQAASHCNTCDWGDNIRERGVATLLPQAQKMRNLASVLVIRARHQIAEGKMDEAIETFRFGYTLARNMSQGCTLVQDLIGIAIQNVLDDQLRTLIAVENSPNLYWALTERAASPIDLRQAFSFETKLWNFTIHELADLDRRVLSPQEALGLAQRIAQVSDASLQTAPALLIWVVQLEPEARKYLLANSLSAAQLEPMPVLQIVLLYRWKQYETVRDDCFKWLLLPDSEIRTEFQRSDRVAREAAQSGAGRPFVDLLPGIFASQYARMRSERYTAALRIVEALRMHAAEHGKWPATLNEIKAASVPRDPYTEKPFDYAVKDGVATLSCPADPGKVYAALPVVYELTLRRATNKQAGDK
jgi:hypothetical protein